MRVVFMGSSGFAVPALDALADAGHEIVNVYTQPPRPSGRGKSRRLPPVGQRAMELGFDLQFPKRLDADCVREFCALRSDVAIVAAYGKILPPALLDAPRWGCLNIHPSLLPRWRGAAPVHRAILAGDKTTGICIIKVEPKLDSGPILLREQTTINASETASSLEARLAILGANLVVETLDRLSVLKPETQATEGVTYARKIDKAEARIDWTRAAWEVDNKIRGFSRFPGAWGICKGERIKLLNSKAGDGEGRPGQVIDDDFTVACGEGAVTILKAQRPGRRPMSAKEFARGFSLGAGTAFEIG